MARRARRGHYRVQQRKTKVYPLTTGHPRPDKRSEAAGGDGGVPRPTQGAPAPGYDPLHWPRGKGLIFSLLIIFKDFFDVGLVWFRGPFKFSLGLFGFIPNFS